LGGSSGALLVSDIAVFAVVFVAGASAVYLATVRRSTRLTRESFIRHFVFPTLLLQSLKKTYPNLEEKDLFLVARALRQFFLVYLKSRNQTVGMPSQVVDALWHDFILDTKSYHAFSIKAFGSYFHHVPAGKKSLTGSKGDAMRLTWRLACLEENIDPKKATRLPLLFAIDSKLKIPDGHIYDLEVVKKATGVASDTGCGGLGCTGGDCCSSGCSGSCGGGCGGD
jgi:hypothetical protein